MNKSIILFAALFLAISMVSASDTQINVKTFPSHKVSIQVLDPSQVYALLNSYHIYANENGTMSAVYSGAESKINLKISISKDGTYLTFDGSNYQLFENYDSGKPIYIQMIPGDVKISYESLDKPVIENITKEETNVSETAENATIEKEAIPEENKETQENKEENNGFLSGISGMAISIVESSKGYAKIAGYIIAVVLLISVIIFLIFRFKSSRNLYSGDLKKDLIKKPEQSSALINTQAANLEESLRQKERELAEARKEIGRLKNQEKIKEIERKIAEESRELERLKNGVPAPDFLNN